MTREEAIKTLKANVMVACDTSDKVGYGTPLNKAIEQALDMAIKSLEQETVSRESYEHEYLLRKEFELKIDELQRQLKALEQEPCENAVSREQVLLALTGKNLSTKNTEELISLFNKRIKALPSVTPTRKKGKWKHDYSDTVLECSKCRRYIDIDFLSGIPKYCPYCGSFMMKED